MRVIINIVILAAVSLVLTVAAAAQSAKADVSKAAWMAGCWEARYEQKGLIIREQWSKPEGGILFGVARAIKDGAVSSWEFLRIEQQGDSAKFLAILSGSRPSPPLDLRSATATEFVFEDLKKGFPQRIIYRTLGKDKLAARIEGDPNDPKKGIDFTYNRIKCEADQ